MVVASSGRKRQVYVAFSPLESDFPLQIGFPVLIGNILDFLIGKQTSDVVSVKVGQSFVVPSEGEPSGSLTSPEGQVSTLDSRDGRIIVRGLNKSGRYGLKVGKKSRTVYATLKSPTESTIAPRSNLDMGSSGVKSVTDLTRFEDFWKPLILVVLVVLGVEWWTYARRS